MNADAIALPTTLPDSVPALDAIDFANDVLAKNGQHVAATTLRRAKREYHDLLRALIAERVAHAAFAKETSFMASERLFSARTRTDESLARIIGEMSA